MVGLEGEKFGLEEKKSGDYSQYSHVTIYTLNGVLILYCIVLIYTTPPVENFFSSTTQ